MKQTFNIMKKIVQNISSSVELKVLKEMTKLKIILGALALNITGFIFMYGILDLLLFIKYDL